MRGSQTHFPQGNGNEAGGHSPGQSIHREGNFIKALHCFFPQGTAMKRGDHPGQDKRRSGNFIKAAHFFFFGGDPLGRRMMAATMVASALMTLPMIAGSLIIEVKTRGAVSNLNGGGLCA